MSRRKEYPDRAVCDENDNIIGYVCGSIHRKRWQAHLIWVAIFTIVVGWTVSSLITTRQHNCREISQKIQFTLSPDLEQLVKLKEGTLTRKERKSLPGYTYYHEHPQELDSAIAASQKRVEEFNPNNCK